MVIDDILSAAGFLKNNLQSFIDYWTKGIQIIADSLFDPAEDNSHEIFTVPPEFYLTVYKETRGKNFTDAYLDKSGGMQPFLFAFTVKLQDGVLSFPNMQCIGRTYSGHWSYLTDAEAAALENLVREYPLELDTYSDYPTEPVLLHYANTNNYSFKPRFHDPTDMGYEYTDFNGGHLVSEINIQFLNDDMYMTGDYINFDFTLYDFDNKTCRGFFKQPFMMVTDSMTAVNDYIAANNADHNYSDSVTTGDGDDFTVYYGDNYIIYYIPTAHKLSYNDIQITTQRVVNKIVSDNPGMTPIHVPTYDENKFGPEPPEPEPVTDDDYVDMGLGVETDGMAMYNMAVVTRDELIQLITDFEANADTGLSFIPHVLGLYKLGFESSVLLTTKTEQIKLHKEPSGTSAFTSVENYNIVENQEVLIDCGSITVDREELLTNTFLDFSPYTTYEMFIPGCGWITLPDTIVGRTISVAIVFDLTTCSCKGVVRSEGKLLGGSGTTLATVNGIIGSSVPLSINETGLQRAAIMNGATQAAMALGTAFMGVGIGNPYMGASGVAMAASALASNHIAGNSTYTSTKGGATDYSVFGDGWKAVLKITRPVLEIPDNYGHSVGFVVNRYDTLSNFSGFTVCVNPHIHISATSDEKEEIKRLLEEGVILPEGE